MTQKARTLLLPLVICISLVLILPLHAYAATSPSSSSDVPDQYVKASVADIIVEETDPTAPDGLRFHQQLRITVLDGADARSDVVVDYYANTSKQRLSTGEEVVAVKVQGADGAQYQIADVYRLPQLWWLLGLFFVLTLFFARGRGISSLVGLIVSIAILAVFVIPKILAGWNPLGVSLSGAILIALISIYLAHGFSKRTSVALAGTLITLVLSVGLVALFVPFMKLFGIGTDEAAQLQVSNIDLRGLLMGGIIIGALGVLNDITTAQSAAIYELYDANPVLKMKELYKKGLRIGREHITSLINTLALTYVGAAFPLLLLLTLYPKPLWVVLNSEDIMQEIIRTLIGGLTLMFAVPITTFLAAYFISKKKKV